ncbi:MAG: VOC family protein [Acidimicrobiales bacterium]|jgi:catechol 2,3-dioxygenase-like lactoylglutathione lyase family enzyme
MTAGGGHGAGAAPGGPEVDLGTPFGDMMERMASITGLHHVRLPVSNITASAEWYVATFGFEVILYEEEETRPVGAVLRHPSGVIVGLHLNRARSLALKEFSILGLAVASRDDLEQWILRLDDLDTGHGSVLRGHVGWYVEVPDPDGIVVQLHTEGQPDVEEG